MISLCAVITDLRDYRIPNWLIMTGYAIGFWYRIMSDGSPGVGQAVIGAGLPLLILFPIFLIRGLGAGDIKLFSVIGTFLSLQETIACIVTAIFLGAIISIGQLIGKQIFQKQKKEFGRKSDRNVIHFSIPIFLSVLAHIGGFY